MQYTYHINLDERGSFEADVRNAFDRSVFEISGYEIFEDGFMKNKTDVSGLEKYLKQIGILQPTDTLKAEYAEGGQFDTSYKTNPEYIALKKEYDEEVAKIRPRSGSSAHEARAEKLRTQMKRLALGSAYRKFEDGGSLNIGKVIQAAAGYNPPFRHFKKTLFNNKNAEGKVWGVKFKPELAALAQFKNNPKYEAMLIDGFKQHCETVLGTAQPLIYSVSEQTPELIFSIQTFVK